MPTWSQIWPKNENEKSAIATVPKRDGFLAWCICISAFLSNAVIIGIDCSFGESIGSIMRNFNASSGDAAWIGSLHSSMQFFAAFAASPLVKYYGFGPIILFGIFVAFISFGIALFSHNLICLVVSYGVLAGMGLGLAYNPANIVCAFYFEKYRPLAVALANSGSGFGTIIMAYVLNWINARSGWKGSVLICAIVTPLISSLAVFVWVIPMNNKKEENMSATKSPGALSYQDITPSLDMDRTEGNKSDASKSKYQEKTINNNNAVATEQMSLIKHDKSVKESDAATKMPENRNCHDNPLLFDFSILKHSTIYVYCMSQSITLLAFYIPLDFLPDMMMNVHNISRVNAGNIITIIGIGRTIGGIVLGITINIIKIRAISICSFTFISLGFCCIGYVFCQNYVIIACLSFANGILHGFTYVIIPLTLLELFGLESITDAYGMVMFSSGITVAFGLPLVGYLIHELKSYATAFILGGVLFFVSGILSISLLSRNPNRCCSK